ncbi:MAG: hypothetical protein V4558_05825 [Gemmatimonadota bacterium]
MRSFVIASLLIAAPVALHAQAPVAMGTPQQLVLMTKLVGVWEGEASMVMGPDNKQIVQQRETVEAVAGGTAFTIKGLGTQKLPDGSLRTVHDAFAVITLDHDHLTPMMRAHVSLGANWIDPEFTLRPDGYTWKMNDPRAGMIRYEMAFDNQGRWVEKGFMSRDEGKSWTQFFEMRLTRGS